jgi:hypothetical protein
LSASYLGINKHFVEHSAALQEGAEELGMVRLTGKISAKALKDFAEASRAQLKPGRKHRDSCHDLRGDDRVIAQRVIRVGSESSEPSAISVTPCETLFARVSTSTA